MASITTLVNFDTTHGATPVAGLIADAAGDLFGTTQTGGANGDGTVFEIVKTASGYASTPTMLFNFDFDGTRRLPAAGLIADAAGDLFGTTASRRREPRRHGVRDREDRLWLRQPPHRAVQLRHHPRRLPRSRPDRRRRGDLFGTTQFGGANSLGTVFEIVKTASGYASTPTMLVSFNGTNGASPAAGLIADAAGDLFGTTVAVARAATARCSRSSKTASGYASTPTMLFSFDGTHGAEPVAGLIADAAGDLFGTTQFGGASDRGTVFEIVKTASGYASTPTVLFNFDGTHGAQPVAGLIA